MHASATPPAPHRRTTVYVFADQCSLRNTALADVDRNQTVVLMIESMERGRLQPYHKRKLVMIISVMRHFARDLRREGWEVDYYEEYPDYPSAIAQHVERYHPQRVRMMHQSEYGATESFISAFAQAGLAVEVTRHGNFVSSDEDLNVLADGPHARVTMETFYRRMRRRTGLLMDGEGPAGGRWNYDAENRLPPERGMRFPDPPRFEPDAITRDAIALVERRFPDHPGIIGDFHLAVTRSDALAAADDFMHHRLDAFGPHQDAMIAGERSMYHSLLSHAINVGLLHPLELCERAELAYRSGAARLSSVEGYIRQLIGWREYIWRVYWKLMPEYRERNALQAREPLPEFYWTGETDMLCLHEAVTHVRETGYAHHILRLMILGNFGLIAGIDPVALNNWFWAMFVDGYDWVMVPNVIGMTLHADGGYVGTKPYAASANYINRMSNYCKPCRYDPKKLDGEDACPFNALYWDFIARHEERFAANHRMTTIVRAWRARPLEWQARVRTRARTIRRNLQKRSSAEVG